MTKAAAESKYVPLIGIQEFRKGQLTDPDQLLFNDLHGERHIDKPHKHDFFIIILFDQAQGTHTIDFRDYQIENRQIHLLFPGQVHQWAIGAQTIGYQLMIDRVFFERFASYLRFSHSNYMNHPVIPLSGDDFRLLNYEFDAIKKELHSTHPLKDLISARAAVIAALVSKASEDLFDDFRMHPLNPKLTRFNALIEGHFKEQKLVAFYASKLHISANYLNILCKKNLHTSATQVIQKRVLLEAKRMLRSTDLSIKEISFDLGFVDHAYFSNFFKSQTGATPTQFREKL